jgi:hypothetical protein
MYYVVISKPARPGDPPALENGSWHWDADDDGQPRFVVRDVSSGDYVVSATVLYFPK